MQEYLYSIVGAKEAFCDQTLARATVEYARQELGLAQDVSISWFLPYDPHVAHKGLFSHEAAINGLARRDTPDTIYVNALQPTEDTLETILHEMRHLAQFQQGLANGYSEIDAEVFAKQHLDYVLARGPKPDATQGREPVASISEPFAAAMAIHGATLAGVAEQRKDKTCGRKCVTNKTGSCGDGRPCGDAKSKQLRSQYRNSQSELKGAYAKWQKSYVDKVKGAMRR
jgi:hypothetical protein